MVRTYFPPSRANARVAAERRHSAGQGHDELDARERRPHRGQRRRKPPCAQLRPVKEGDARRGLQRPAAHVPVEDAAPAGQVGYRAEGGDTIPRHSSNRRPVAVVAHTQFPGVDVVAKSPYARRSQAGVHCIAHGIEKLPVACQARLVEEDAFLEPLYQLVVHRVPQVGEPLREHPRTRVRRACVREDGQPFHPHPFRFVLTALQRPPPLRAVEGEERQDGVGIETQHVQLLSEFLQQQCVPHGRQQFPVLVGERFAPDFHRRVYQRRREGRGQPRLRTFDVAERASRRERHLAEERACGDLNRVEGPPSALGLVQQRQTAAVAVVVEFDFRLADVAESLDVQSFDSHGCLLG